MEQLPTLRNVTVLPLTVHTTGVTSENVTGKPAGTVALAVKVPVPSGAALGAVKVIVWTARTVNERLSTPAALKFVSPACEAFTVHVPPPTRSRSAPVGPNVVHTLGVVDAKLTVRPDVDVATSVKLESLAVCVGGPVNEMICPEVDMLWLIVPVLGMKLPSPAYTPVRLRAPPAPIFVVV
jgi:hypothetical protein